MIISKQSFTNIVDFNNDKKIITFFKDDCIKVYNVPDVSYNKIMFILKNIKKSNPNIIIRVVNDIK